MKNLFIASFALFCVLSSAKAQQNPEKKNLSEQDWVPLVDELSRQQLFESHIRKPVEILNLDLDIFALKSNFVFPKDALYDSLTNLKRVDTIFGIDISHHKPKMNFELLRSQNITFVYSKATQGTIFKDPLFGNFWKTIAALPAEKKVFRGAYHFLTAEATDTAVAQAESFAAYLKLQGGIKNSDLPPVMDLEWDKASSSDRDRWKSVNPDEIVTRALEFLNRVEELTGRTPMIYTSGAWWHERGLRDSDIHKFKRYRLWLADYSNGSQLSEVPRAPDRVVSDLWQFTDRSSLKIGSSETLDANIFHGTRDQFWATFFGR